MAQEGKEIDRVPLELALEHFGSHDILAKDAFENFLEDTALVSSTNPPNAVAPQSSQNSGPVVSNDSVQNDFGECFTPTSLQLHEMQPALDWANPEDFEFDFSDNWDGDLGSSNFPSQNEQTKRDLPPDLKYLNMLHEQASDCEKLEIAKQREQLKLDTIKSNGRVELLKIELERTRLRHASEKPI